MAKRVIRPKNLPDPRRRYSHGILVKGGKLLFIAGQTAADINGNIVGKGDIEAQSHQVFKRLSAILKEAGGSLDNLVMVTAYVTDRKYRDVYNRVRLQYYKKIPPTSTLAIVKGLANKDYLIEIAGIAVL